MDEVCRLFLAPADPLATLVDWVEKGRAPEVLIQPLSTRVVRRCRARLPFSLCSGAPAPGLAGGIRAVVPKNAGDTAHDGMHRLGHVCV